jgi:hypothetical protein
LKLLLRILLRWFAALFDSRRLLLRLIAAVAPTVLSRQRGKSLIH